MCVRDELSDVHCASRFDCRRRFSGTALIPFDDDKILLQQAIEAHRGHLRLAGAAMKFKEQRILRIVAANQNPLRDAAEIDLFQTRHAARYGIAVVVTDWSGCRGSAGTETTYCCNQQCESRRLGNHGEDANSSASNRGPANLPICKDVVYNTTPNAIKAIRMAIEAFTWRDSKLRMADAKPMR